MAADESRAIAQYAPRLLIKVPNHTNTTMPPKTTEKAVEKPAAAEVEGARQK